MALDKTFLVRKVGPLPMWAWMGLSLGGAVAFASWRRNKASAGAAPPTGDAVQQMYSLPQNLQPAYTFVDADTSLNTYQFSPPGGGRPPTRPLPPPVPVPTLPGPPPPPAPVPTPKPVPVTPAPAPAPSGVWVTVSPWKANQPAGYPSTVWGIAESVYGAGKGALYKQIWSAPQNAALVAKRGAPEKIQPGDRFWVPK
jgi:hypothetical protein